MILYKFFQFVPFDDLIRKREQLNNRYVNMGHSINQLKDQEYAILQRYALGMEQHSPIYREYMQVQTQLEKYDENVRRTQDELAAIHAQIYERKQHMGIIQRIMHLLRGPPYGDNGS